MARERTDWERVAWQTAHLMNVSGKVMKKPVKPGDLIGAPKPTPTRERPTKQVEQDAKEVIRRAEGG
jgi:hypothetical protein